MAIRDDRIKGIVLISITTLLWGFLAIALKMATNKLDPITITWFRFTVSFIILFIYYIFTNRTYLKILWNPPRFLVIAALGLGLNYIGFLYGVKLTTPGNAQIIMQLGPISLGLVGLFFFKESISRRQALGFLVAGVGLFLFYEDNIIHLAGKEEIYNMGVLWIIVAAIAWVVYAAFIKILVKSIPAMQLNLFLFGLPVVLFLPFISPASLSGLSGSDWGLMIFLGLNTIIPYSFLVIAFKYLEANKISIIITMNPLITFITMGFLTYFNIHWIEPEVLSFKGIIAALVVVAGAIMAVAFAKPAKKKEITELITKL